MILEMHSHTAEFSTCSHVAAVDLVRRACELGLQGIVLTAIRSADSDRAAAVDDSVAAYLHEATEGDAEAVAARIRGLWRAGKHGPLRVQIFTDRSAAAAALPAPASRKMS